MVLKNRKSEIQVVIFLIFFASTFAQNQIIYFQEKDENNLLETTKIIFKEIKPLHTDTFDIRKKNPFNHLKYKKTGLNFQGNNNYVLSKSELERLLPMDYSNAYDETKKKINLNSNSYKATSTYSIYKESNEFVSIGFTLHIADSMGIWIAALGGIMIVNKHGHITYIRSNFNINIGKSVVTENGKYFAYTYGYIGEDGVYIKDGFRVYDAEKNQLITERRGENLGVPCTSDNCIIVRDLLPGKSLLYYVFDSERQILYSKEYDAEDRPLLDSITPKAFIFRTEDGKKRFDYYNEVFTKDLLKEH